MKSVARERAVPLYIVDDAVYRRFDPRHHCFGRSTWDSTASFHGQGIHDRAAERIARASDEGDERYDWIEFCRARASWTVEDYFEGAYARERLGTPVEAIATRGRIEQSPSVMSEVVRETAMQYGADLVGFCRVDRRWLYDMTPATLRDAPRYARDPVPDGLDQAVVMAIAMDATAIHQSPGFAAARATGIGYSRMAFVASCLAQFIRNLGYRALPMGNDTALSIPLAIDAGLGQLGRNGLLITPEFGPCVRLCKVLTDLPLDSDEPIDFGLATTCRQCRRCAEACEVGAISAERAPTFSTVSPSNNPGILRWPVNHDLCYSFWIENGASCSNCIAACPYTPSGGD